MKVDWSFYKHRRKVGLADFCKSTSVKSYDELLSALEVLGINPPPEDGSEWQAAHAELNSSPPPPPEPEQVLETIKKVVIEKPKPATKKRKPRSRAKGAKSQKSEE